MKIAMVSEHANPLAEPGSVDSGGQNVHVAALSRALAARGHEVTVYTRRDNARVPTRVALCDGVEVVHLAAGPVEHVAKDELLPYMGAFADALASAWLFKRPDIVHGHFWMSGLASLGGVRRLLEEGDRPAIVETFHALGSVKRRHQGILDTSPAERARLEPLVGRRVDAVIATCDDEVSELRALGIPAERIEIAPCGVDPLEFAVDGPTLTEPPFDAPADFRLLSVGRLVPRKGVDLAIRALAQLAVEGVTGVELDIAGEGELDGADGDSERVRLEELATRLGVAERVHFLGRVPRERMPALLRSVDAVVCTPWYEPFGIVPLESMACGTPVIVAAVGGLQDSVVDHVTGLHVPAKDPQALAKAIRELAEDTWTRVAYGSAGRRRVATGYAWASVAERTEEIYERVIARSRLAGIRAAGAVS